jgi:DNA polymerase-3 subunit epsilon
LVARRKEQEIDNGVPVLLSGMMDIDGFPVNKRGSNRLRIHKKFWWFLAVATLTTLVVLYTNFYLLWKQMGADDQALLKSIVTDYFGHFFIALFFILTVIGFTIEWFFRFYIIPVNQLAEETHLINTVNPALKVRVQGSADVRRLAHMIIQNGEVLAEMKQSLEKRLKQAQRESQSEKEILAALLSDLPQGIVVCNGNGGIVFYNRKAKNLLERKRQDPKEGHAGNSQWIGLGRSVYAFIDETLIGNALERAARKLDQGEFTVNERFLVTTSDMAVLPAELLPVLDAQRKITGFIVYIEDLVDKIAQDANISRHMQTWQHQMIQSVSVIKAAVDILKNKSFQSIQERNQLFQILTEESDLAADLMQRSDVSTQWSDDQPWPLTPTPVDEWAQFIAQRVDEVLDMRVVIRNGDIAARISIDTHHLTSGLVLILNNVIRLSGVRTVYAHFHRHKSWLYLDMTWKGEGLSNAVLKQLKREPLDVNSSKLALPLSDILNYHGAKLWNLGDQVSQDCSGFRLLVPLLGGYEIVRSNGLLTILPDARPEYYDFDLFKQAGQTMELDNRDLTELTYTVFDTETTGLDPNGGDEIISMGAVRIVNGRLLPDENFDQLVNPKRDVPWESVKYHGIRSEMLEDKPDIGQVLPNFFQFVQGTILIGHNVAFDMRMLQIKEAQTGIRFINPILDTMLLSAVVHPAHKEHGLNAIAERLGITIKGRHTALGDAIATAEVLLKLVSLLKGIGINTLIQARQASEKTLFARLKY